MPFVLAHPAAVLPLRRFCGRFLSLPALILGSLAPDSAYVFGRLDLDVIAHRPVSGMVYSTITGMLVLGVLALWPRVRKALPTRLASRLPFPETIAWSWFPGIVFSLMLGALTHVMWDSFTHKEAWVVYRFPFLRMPVLEIGYRTLRVCHLLWYASSFLGVAYVCLVYAEWRARTAPPHEAASPRRRFWSSVAVAVLLIPVAVLHHAIHGAWVDVVVGILTLGLVVWAVMSLGIRQGKSVPHLQINPELTNAQREADA